MSGATLAALHGSTPQDSTAPAADMSARAIPEPNDDLDGDYSRLIVVGSNA